MQQTVIPFSISRWIAILLGCLAFVAAGVWMLADHENTKNTIFGALAVLFFGYGVWVAAARLIRRRPELIVGDAGIELATGVKVGWDEIESVGMRTIKGSRFSREVIEVVLHDPAAHAASLQGAAALSARANLAAGYSPVTLPSLGSRHPNGAILDLLRRHHPGLVITSFPAASASRMNRLRRLGLKVAAWAVFIVVAFAGITFWLNKTGDISTARVGKCLAMQGDDGDSAKVVDCGAGDARYKVVGQVDHKTKAESDAQSLCDPYPGATAQFWYGKAGEQGVVWCLGPAN
jgi:hypothetical protein